MSEIKQTHIAMDDAALFVQIVQAQSLARAAERLGIPPATVTRRLKRFEAAIGAQLIHRSARKFALTSEGSACFEALAGPVDQVTHALRSLDQKMHQMSGPLTVAAPANVAVNLLRPMWSGFIAKHPDIRLDLRLSNQFADLVDEGIDLALRIGPQPDSTLTRKRLGTSAVVLVASPAYLAKRGMPKTPEELEHHRILGLRILPQWRLTHRQTQETRVLTLSAAAAFDDLVVTAGMARDGAGIALLPVSELGGDFEAGRLVHILPDWRGLAREIYVVWPTGRLLSARAKAMRAEMERFIRLTPELQGKIPGLR